MIGHGEFGELARTDRIFKIDGKSYVVLAATKDRWAVATVVDERVGHPTTDFSPHYVAQKLGDATVAAIAATFKTEESVMTTCIERRAPPGCIRIFEQGPDGTLTHLRDRSRESGLDEVKNWNAGRAPDADDPLWVAFDDTGERC